MKVLVANRGEVAVRVCRAARGLGVRTVVAHVPEDADAPYLRLADETRRLPGHGVAGYLDIEALVGAAVESGCTQVHPGWGFLSEDAAFARACADAGLRFVGPSPEVLALFGDKARARAHAVSVGVPVLEATEPGVSLPRARDFLAAQPGGVMVKAVAGGGGRGIRVVTEPDRLAQAIERCRSEARTPAGPGEVYLERLLRPAKHVEVQIVGDGTGAVVSLGERDCSVQRRQQKLIEVAPCPVLTGAQRDLLAGHALRMVETPSYGGVGTVEFLLDADALVRGDLVAAFIEVNPRLQVEHPVTEEITGIDLVRTQLRLADGASLADLGLTSSVGAAPVGFAIQARVNTERIGADGQVHAATGTVRGFRPPGGPGVRVDTHAEAGLRVDGRFDPLLAKIVTRTRHGDFASAAAQAARALAELAVDGVDTNAAVLGAILTDPVFTAGRATTDLLPGQPAEAGFDAEESTGEISEVVADCAGTVVSVEVGPGERVPANAPVVIVESMKMEQVITAGPGGRVTAVEVSSGARITVGQVLVRFAPAEVDAVRTGPEVAVDPDVVRPDLADLYARHALGADAARPEALARRHRTGHRTIRENLADLVDEGSFTEYGSLAIAAQRRRRSLSDLMAATPADGIVLGLARINGPEGEGTQCAVLGYDYTVLAGTQGFFGHRKTDRMLEIALRRRLPVVLFAEGGGGRPGDVDPAEVSSSWLDCGTFAAMGRLSGQVPTVGVLTGRCFAGNAALLGSCDVIIATEDSTLGMAGPAMIEGGGLGRFAPEEVGPMSVQVPNGVVDVLVDGDAEAVAVARRYLSYFQGTQPKWDCADQRLLRRMVPENRLRVYDVRRVVDGLADTDSVLELRAGFGLGVVTALIRVAGRPMGLVANNPARLGGAIDADAADKLARFLQLCDAHGLPVVSLCDTPGFMVGPDSERAATVRHFSRLFVVGAQLRVPMITVVLRKGYGLGAQAMAAGGFRETLATVAWPTGELGPMGLEGAVRLGYGKELAALSDEHQRRQRYSELLARHYESGKAVNAAMVFEIDDVIDPADTRQWITDVVGAWQPTTERAGRYVDTW